MSVIPQFVIDNLSAEYNEGSALWAKYPEIDQDMRDRLRTAIEQDKAVVRDMSFYGIVQQAPLVYLGTAGAPAAGKSTLLEQVIHANPERYGNVVKTDPDVYAMKNMIYTYNGLLMSPRMVAAAPDFAAAQRRAYDIARPASNVIANGILNEAITSGYNVAHGTTMTGGTVDNLLRGVKQNGYTVDLLLCYAPDQMRVDSVRHRVEQQADYHVTPEDVRTKGALFPQRFEIYFTYADNMTLYWRDQAAGMAVKAATFADGVKTVVDADAFRSFSEQFEADRAALSFNKNAGKDVIVPPALADLEQAYQARFSKSTAAPAIKI